MSIDPCITPSISPKVSILMAVYNGDRYLDEAIESIQRQTYTDFEFIIVNDGSNEITKKILERQIDSRIIVLHNKENVGLTKSLNSAITKSRGRYIARMDADDLSHTRRLQVQVEFLDKYPNIALVGSSYYVINDNGMVMNSIVLPTAPKDIKIGIKRKNLFGHGTVMLRREVFNTVGNYDESFKYSQDYDLWLRVTERYNAANIPVPLYYWRLSKNCISYKQTSEQKKYSNLARHNAQQRSRNNAQETGQKVENNGSAKIDNIPAQIPENNCYEKPDYAVMHKAMLAHPDDVTGLRAYFNAAKTEGNLNHAKREFQRLIQANPWNHIVRKFLIAIYLDQKNLHAAMKEIEILIAFSGPEDDLITSAVAVRDQLGPRILSGSSEGKSNISLCMIVKNEQAFLGPCLNSIKNTVDEIIVIDTGSSDRSADIARIYGARVIRFKWCDDFSAARNFSLDHAKGDWALIVDADEIISPKELQEIRMLVANDSEKRAAYTFKTRNYINQANAMTWQANDGSYAEQEAGMGWFPTDKVRLFPLDDRIRFRYPVQELVDPSICEAGLEIKACAIPIHHYGCLNEAKSLKKAAHYFDLGYKKLEQLGNDKLALRELAVQAGQLEMWDKAIDLWQRFLKIDPDYSEALANLAGAFWQLGDYDSGLAYAKKSILINPDLKEGHYNLAVNLMFKAQLSEASQLLQELLRGHPNYLAAEFMLAVALSLDGNFQQGQSMFRSIKKKTSSQIVSIAVGDILKKLAGSGLAGKQQKLVEAAGFSPGTNAKDS